MFRKIIQQYWRDFLLCVLLMTSSRLGYSKLAQKLGNPLKNSTIFDPIRPNSTVFDPIRPNSTFSKYSINVHHYIDNEEFSTSVLIWSGEKSFDPGYESDYIVYPRESPSKDERFLSRNNTMVQAQVGSNVFLHCKTIRNVGGLVSWIKKRVYQLLTVGLELYSTDDRFLIDYSNWDWKLYIRDVQAHDAGAYECQIATHPPVSILVHLRVEEAAAKILGTPVMYAKHGSVLKLVCIIQQASVNPDFLFWYRDAHMINLEERSIIASGKHTSMLTVHNVSMQDSANYTCSPSNVKPASILVHVQTEHQAPKQHGVSLTEAKTTGLFVFSVLINVVPILFSWW